MGILMGMGVNESIKYIPAHVYRQDDLWDSRKFGLDLLCMGVGLTVKPQVSTLCKECVLSKITEPIVPLLMSMPVHGTVTEPTHCEQMITLMRFICPLSCDAVDAAVYAKTCHQHSSITATISASVPNPASVSSGGNPVNRVLR